MQVGVPVLKASPAATPKKAIEALVKRITGVATIINPPQIVVPAPYDASARLHQNGNCLLRLSEFIARTDNEAATQSQGLKRRSRHTFTMNAL